MGNKKKVHVIFLILALTIMTAHVCIAEEESKEPIEKNQDQSYRIGNGDILDIMTWKEPDFTRSDVLVRNDGNISFPLLGDIQVTGLSPLEVQHSIETGLKVYVSSPLVTVTVVKPESQKFYILGEVENTGEYDLRKELTILQAFALAGGFTQWASKKEIILLRQKDDSKATDDDNGKNTEEEILRINYSNIIKGKDLSQNVKIKANDTIIVP